MVVAGMPDAMPALSDLKWAINFVKHDGMQAMFHKLTRTVNQNQEFDVKISYKNQ